MLAVQLQQLCPHDLGWIIVACNADSAAGAANRLLHQLGDLVKLLSVNARIACQNIIVDILQNQVPIAFKCPLRFRFCAVASGKPEGKGIESVIDKSLLCLFLFLVLSVFNCVGFSNVGLSNIGFSNVGLSNAGFSCVGSSGVGSVCGCS